MELLAILAGLIGMTTTEVINLEPINPIVVEGTFEVEGIELIEYLLED